MSVSWFTPLFSFSRDSATHCWVSSMLKNNSQPLNTLLALLHKHTHGPWKFKIKLQCKTVPARECLFKPAFASLWDLSLNFSGSCLFKKHHKTEECCPKAKLSLLPAYRLCVTWRGWLRAAAPFPLLLPSSLFLLSVLLLRWPLLPPSHPSGFNGCLSLWPAAFKSYLFFPVFKLLCFSAFVKIL